MMIRSAALAALLLVASPFAALAASTCAVHYIAPAASQYTAQAADDGTMSSPANATGPGFGEAGATLTTALPSPAAVGIGWAMCFTSDNNRVSIVDAPLLAAPAAPTTGVVNGGSLGGTTYYVKLTYINATGETVGSSESSRAAAPNQLLTVTSPGALGNAVSYRVYAAISPGGEMLQTATPIAIGTGWTEPLGGLISGVSPPATGTATAAYILAGNQTLGQLVVGPDNYAFAWLIADGTNFRIADAYLPVLAINGAGAQMPARWIYPGGPGYSATVYDSGNQISSGGTSGGLTLTLPAIGAVPAGWTIGVAADGGQPLTVVSTGGTMIQLPTGQRVSSWSGGGLTYFQATIQSDGTSYRVGNFNAGSVSGPTSTTVCDAAVWASTNGTQLGDASGWCYSAGAVTQPKTQFTGPVLVPGGAVTSFALSGGTSLEGPGPAELYLNMGGGAGTDFNPGAIALNAIGEEPQLVFNRSDVPLANTMVPVGQFVWTGLDGQGAPQNWCIQQVQGTTAPLISAESAAFSVSCLVSGIVTPLISAGVGGVGVPGLYPLATTIGAPVMGDGWPGYAPLDPAATNLLLRSNALQTSPWSLINAGATPAAAPITPYGGTDAETLTSTAAAGNAVQTVNGLAADSSIYIASVFISSATAAGATPAILLVFSGGQGYECTLTINPAIPAQSTTAPSGAAPAACGYILLPAASDGGIWYRLYVAGANSGTNSVSVRVYPNQNGGPATAIVYGVQLEKGAAATSYIQTASAQVSRPILAITPKTTTYHTADLPACNAASSGEMLETDDAAATPTYGGSATGGGSLKWPVWCDGGGTWKYH